jgi:GT2 family glycosyltransferase
MLRQSEFFSDANPRYNAYRPSVSVVMTVRERFSMFGKSLTSLYANTPNMPPLVVVTGGAPAATKAWLAAESERLGFLYINRPSFLTPAEARNIGCSLTITEYVAFVENDVSFERGWLDKLLLCALETSAGVVCPVICEGELANRKLHHTGKVAPAGKPLDISSERKSVFGEVDFFKGHTMDAVRPLLHRRRILTAETHCFLARRDVLTRAKGFDSNIVFGESVDFSWKVRRTGDEIWLEPASIFGCFEPSLSDPVAKEDVAYFRRRWSKRWRKRSLAQIAHNWNFEMEGVGDQWASFARKRVVGLVGSRIPLYSRYRSIKTAFRRRPVLEDWLLRWSLMILEAMDGPKRKRNRR